MSANTCTESMDSEFTPFTELIALKRDGKKLNSKQIHDFVFQVIKKHAQEAQIGAMLMAMYIRGLDVDESVSLTRCMFTHGSRMKWDKDLEPLLVDKHSTGGVGDKVSLVLAPALAACGLKVPMLSGRGLDFTGGTLDKLESIKGFETKLSMEEMKNALHEAGCFIAGPTAEIVPADGALYGIRDVTATVKNKGLIIGSILSKKLAGGGKAFVLDLKVGRAALYTDENEARQFAELFVEVATKLGLPTRVVLTSMNKPIGRAVGNALEVAETLETLNGKGPEDLVDLVAELGGQLLHLKKFVRDVKEGAEKIRKSLQDGSAMRHFKTMLRCQRVDETFAAALCGPDGPSFLPSVPAAQITDLEAQIDGVVDEIDGLSVGLACRDLGAGRRRSDDIIDCRVGVKILTIVGTRVRRGESLLRVYHAETELKAAVREKLQNAVVIRSERTKFDDESPIICVVEK